MQFLRIVFFCKFLRKNIELMKNTTINTQFFFLANYRLPCIFYEKKRVHTKEIFAMKILQAVLLLDFQFRLLKTSLMDRYLHKAMGFKGE